MHRILLVNHGTAYLLLHSSTSHKNFETFPIVLKRANKYFGHDLKIEFASNLRISLHIFNTSFRGRKKKPKLKIYTRLQISLMVNKH